MLRGRTDTSSPSRNPSAASVSRRTDTSSSSPFSRANSTWASGPMAITRRILAGRPVPGALDGNRSNSCGRTKPMAESVASCSLPTTSACSPTCRCPSSTRPWNRLTEPRKLATKGVAGIVELHLRNSLVSCGSFNLRKAQPQENDVFIISLCTAWRRFEHINTSFQITSICHQEGMGPKLNIQALRFVKTELLLERNRTATKVCVGAAHITIAQWPLWPEAVWKRQEILAAAGWVQKLI